MFENPKRSRRARNFATNVPEILDLKSSSVQIFFRKLSLGAPANSWTLCGADLNMSVAPMLTSVRRLKSQATFEEAIFHWKYRPVLTSCFKCCPRWLKKYPQMGVGMKFCPLLLNEVVIWKWLSMFYFFLFISPDHINRSCNRQPLLSLQCEALYWEYLIATIINLSQEIITIINYELLLIINLL